MGQFKQKQKAIFVIFGVLSIITGIIGVVIVIQVAFENGELIGLASDRPIGVASILVLLVGGVFVLSKAIKSSNHRLDMTREE
jgi:hypothetical protein